MPEAFDSPQKDAAAPAGPGAPGRLRRVRAFFLKLFSTDLAKTPGRIKLVALVFLALYAVIAGKLIYFGLHQEQAQEAKRGGGDVIAAARPDILDRNGEVLATDIKVMSVFAEPRRIIDKDEAVELLTAVLPDIDANDLRKRLGSRKGFIWV